MYYEQGQDQAEIAKELGVHRSTISRALRECLESGIVEIRITEPLPPALHLERQLMVELGLRGATVAVGADSRLMVARAGCRIVEELLSSRPVTVAVGWGRTVVAMVSAARVTASPGTAVVDAVGHVLWEGSAAGDASRILAVATGADLVPVPAPGYATPRLAAELLAQPTVQAGLGRAAAADAVFVSVGPADASNALVGTALPDQAAMEDLRARGAVGDLLGHFLDASGAQVANSHFATVGLSPAQLKAAGRVYCLASEPEQLPVLRAVIAAGYVDHVVVSAELAHGLLH
ncbi:sugar-binding transcriptional regulator [Streptomyces sp. NPDC001617]